MKLQHFAIGDRFEYEGQIYVKTGPLTASGENDGQRIIPRYAVLKPLSSPENSQKEKGINYLKLDKQKVEAAFDLFYRACKPLVEAQHLPELESARRRFIAFLENHEK